MYLTNRSQFVNLNASNSSVRELTVGIPQGSVMGPVLYLLYTTPFADVIRSHGLDYHMYADDNQLYLSFATQDVDQAKSKIEECITSIRKWMGVNELKLNHDKTEIVMSLEVPCTSSCSIFACWYGKCQPIFFCKKFECDI